MKKRTFFILMAMAVTVMLVLALPAAAETTGTCGEGVTWELKDGILTISGAGEITSNPWIEQKEQIREVIIEEGVTAICDEAFNGCRNMYGATVAASVTKIGRLAFNTGDVLEAFFKGDAPELHNNWYAEPGNGLGPNAFIHYPAGNATWENVAKLVRTKLWAVSYELSGTCGDNLTYSIEGTTLTISGTGKMYEANNNGEHPWHAYSLTIKKVILEEGVTNVAFNTFTYFRALESVQIPDSVTVIDNNAFSNCEKLKAVELPEDVTYIGDGAFRNCKALEEIHIYGKVNEIGIEAFGGCDSLKKVWFHGDAPEWMDMIFGFEDRYDLTAYYPKGNDTWGGRAIADAGDNVTWKTWDPDGEVVEPTEPKPTEPKPTEPKPTEPKPTDPKPTEPLETTPVETTPVETTPMATQPAETQPQETEPLVTDPTEGTEQGTEPDGTQPQTEPVQTDPATDPTAPEETQPVVDREPENGMGWVIIVAIAVLAVAAGGILVLKKRMK